MNDIEIIAPPLHPLRATVPSLLDARADRIRTYHSGCIGSFTSQMCYAFLAGVELLAAKDEIPHGGFLKWREQQFPTLSKGTFDNYLRFAENLQAKFPTVGNLVPRLQLASGEDLTRDDKLAIMAAVHEAADGKTLTEFYRTLGVIRQPKHKEFNPPTQTPEEQAAQKEQLNDEHLVASMGDHALARTDEFISAVTVRRAKEYLDDLVTTAAFYRSWLKTQKQSKSKKSAAKKKS